MSENPAIEQHRMCSACGHVQRVTAAEEHMAIPHMGLRCSGRGERMGEDGQPTRAYHWVAPSGLAWTQFVAAATAEYGVCEQCKQNIRRRANGRLVSHQRPPGPTDRRKTKWVDCAVPG